MKKNEGMISLVELGHGDRRLSFGSYNGKPAFYIEPTPGLEKNEIGTFFAEGRTEVEDGSLVLTFDDIRSISAMLVVFQDFAAAEKADPQMKRLAEADHFCLEAAVHYGFVEDEFGKYAATPDQIISLVLAARAQGQQDTSSWRRRAAWIAGQMKPLLTERYPSYPTRDHLGSSLGHLLWLIEELIAQRVDGETKTCRWLGYVQAGFVFQGICHLETMKDLNMRSKEAVSGS